MPHLLDILLQRNDPEVPWGFQVSGGLDFNNCPVISTVTFGTLASQYLNAGDKILEIENVKGSSLLQSEIEKLLKKDQPTIQLLVEKLPPPCETMQNKVNEPHRSENIIFTTAKKEPYETICEHELIKEKKKSANGTKQCTKIWLREANRDPSLGEYDLQVNFERTKYKEKGNSDDFIKKNFSSNRNQKRMQMMTENFEKIFREKIGEWLETNMLNGPIGKQQSSSAGDETQSVHPAPPPPPSFPGTLPGRRIKTEIPERGLEPPSVIQNAMMTKDKKPFTYTPGGIDLSEIRSPKMQRRINRNACADEMPGIPAPTTNQTPTSPPSTNSHFSAMQSQLPAQVLPPAGGAPPPPPPPPPSGNFEPSSAPPPPPPPATSAPVPKPNAGRPPLGFDPNELLARVNKSQPYVPPASVREEPPVRNFKPQPVEEKHIFEPKQQKSNEIGQNIHVPLQNEPGHIYVPQVTPKVQNEVHNTYVQPQATHPTRGQLGSLYIPPVATVNQEQSAPSPSSPFGYKVQQNSPATVTPNVETKPQAPWVTVYRTPQSTAPWANREAESPKPANTRIIPIQVEGRDSPKPTTPSPQVQTTPPPFLQSQQMRQAQQQQQQQAVRQQSPAQQQPSNTRVIPIQVEGSSQSIPSQQRAPGQGFGQRQFNPMTPQSPTPFSPSQEKEQKPQWAPVQPRPFKKEPEFVTQQRQQDATDIRPQQPQPEYGTYNTAGVPLSQLRKMQLSDDDRALMDKFKSQVEKHGNDIINDENSNPRYRGGYIPSRVFKALDESVDDEKYLHNESDPRYRGACIPSRAFRMLQCMTDTAGEMQQQVPKSPSRGPVSRPLSGAQFQQESAAGPYVPPSEQQVQEPRKYTGGSIPSRSFRMLQAMTGNEVSAPSGPPSGRETPVPGVNRWCPSPSPSPVDPFWGYYPPDPYFIYNYISDLNTAYGFPPPPLPSSFPQHPPYSYYQPYQNYNSDNEEQGYSSTDELAQYYANYRRKFGYSPYQPNPERYSTPNFNIPRVCVTPVQGVKKNQFPKQEKIGKPKEEIEIRHEVKTEVQTADENLASSTDDESESDTEVEDDENIDNEKGNTLQTLKSVPNVNVYTSESSATVTQDDYQEEEEEEEEEEEDVSSSDEESDIKEEPVPHQLSVIFEESEHSDVESIKRIEQTRDCSSTISESESCSTLDNGEDDSDNDVMDAEASVTVRLPLKLQFSRSDNDEDITTVIVGDSQVERDTMYNLTAKKDAEEIVEEDSCESEEGDVSVTFTLPSRSNSVISVEHNSEKAKELSKEVEEIDEIPEEQEIDAEVIVRLPVPRTSEPKEESEETVEKIKTCESPQVEDDSSSSSVQSGDTVLKHKEDTDEDSEEDEKPKMDSFKSWIEKQNSMNFSETYVEETVEQEEMTPEDNSYKAGVGRLEEMISSLLETARDTMSSSMELSEKDLEIKPKSDSTMPLTKKDSQEESEEDDSGVTSDMSVKQMNSETEADTESDYSELSKMTKFQRASTHSRLFKLLQEECERCGNETEDDNSTSELAPTPKEKNTEENLSLRKQKLTLPLSQTFSSEAESLSSSSGIASPSSPTISDRLVKELIHSLLNKKKGKKFRKLPLAKLHAAALKILQEEMDSYDTSPTSGDDGLFLSPMQKKQLHSKLTAKFINPEQEEAQCLESVPESIYGENYYDYLDYYSTWGNPELYGPDDYDIVPSRAFRMLREQTCSPKPIEGFTARCPRVSSKKNIQDQTPGRKTPVVVQQIPDNEPQYERMSFAEKQEKVSKVLEKSAKS